MRVHLLYGLDPLSQRIRLVGLVALLYAGKDSMVGGNSGLMKPLQKPSR